MSVTIDKTGEMLDDHQASKTSRITAACEARDVDCLVQLSCTPGGLVDDSARRLAWPILLGCSSHHVPSATSDCQNLPEHADEHQVALDVNRAFVYYPDGDSEKQLDKRKKELSDLIIETLRKFPYLSYFQGYHDIVQVLLLVLGRDAAGPAVARLSLLRIRDFMLPNMTPSVDHLRLIPPILQAADPGLADHIAGTQPFFALPATLTLYAHEIQEYGDIARLFDFLLAKEACISIYLFVVTILERKDEVLQYERDERDIIHAVLSKLPKPLDVEKLIAKTLELYKTHPPERLPTNPWRRISPHSVLNTSHGPADVVSQQTIEDGEWHFMQQEKQLKRQQKVQTIRNVLWKYRRPSAMTVTLLVGVLSWWLRRDSSGSLVQSLVARLRGNIDFIWS